MKYRRLLALLLTSLPLGCGLITGVSKDYTYDLEAGVDGAADGSSKDASTGPDGAACKDVRLTGVGPTCLSCTSQGCCSQLLTCIQDSSCGNFLKCLENCKPAEASCRNQCERDFARAAAAIGSCVTGVALCTVACSKGG
ncbi:MAG: hypothetical protein HOO96_38095 [Polyangiaceae bacterium]|nr:hypothetical protein [Polyangiaceae bacterium]